MWEHHYEKGHGWQCWERMSYDNNHFCGCSHDMPDIYMLEFLKQKLSELKLKIKKLQQKMRPKKPRTMMSVLEKAERRLERAKEHVKRLKED